MCQSFTQTYTFILIEPLTGEQREKETWKKFSKPIPHAFLAFLSSMGGVEGLPRGQQRELIYPMFTSRSSHLIGRELILR